MAAGDITPTAPRQDTGLTLIAIHIRIDTPQGVFVFRDGFNRTHEVIVQNGTCVGFNYSTGAEVRIASPTLLNAVRTAMLKAGGIKDAVQIIKDAGVIAITGTVGT